MSIVVVVKKAGKAVIAADTMYSFGATQVLKKYMRNSEKLLKVKDSYIGTVGATAHENVLAHLIEKQSRKLSFESRADIFDSYLKIHPVLKESYFLNPTEGDSDEYESSRIDGLIANSNGIFGIYSLREVYEFERFWAIGSGTEFAIGAMFSVFELFDEPEQIAEIAVRAACEFDDGCGLPMDIRSIELKNNE